MGTLKEHVLPIAKRARELGREFGLGGWWPSDLVEELSKNTAACDLLKAQLEEAGVPLWTLNVFPFGDFHAAKVKTDVYAPDWGEDERLAYTRKCAQVGASMMKEGEILPMSTVPLGYRGIGALEPDLEGMAKNLARAAGMMAQLESKTGVRCVIALEPEPNCLIETVKQAVKFFDEQLFGGAIALVPEKQLRRHLGVCVDLCHLAVMGEDPLAALADLKKHGIEVPKIQVSSCLEVRNSSGIDDLLTFQEPRYLHQTVAKNGIRTLDLDGVERRRYEFENAGRIRTHYHVPLDWDQSGAFGSTQAEVRRVLEALAAGSDPVPLLEVETYTWSVLGDRFGDQPLHERIQRELDWVAAFWPA